MLVYFEAEALSRAQYVYISHIVGRLIIREGGPGYFHTSGFTFTQRTSILWEHFDDNIISYPLKNNHNFLYLLIQERILFITTNEARHFICSMDIVR
jgi:hypothetical protein